MLRINCALAEIFRYLLFFLYLIILKLFKLEYEFKDKNYFNSRVITQIIT